MKNPEGVVSWLGELDKFYRELKKLQSKQNWSIRVVFPGANETN